MGNEVLRLNRVSVNFNQKCVLNIQEPITVEEGDVVGIIGENGAGKSTMINTIIDRVSYDGEIQRNFNFKELGIQFQNNEIQQVLFY